MRCNLGESGAIKSMSPRPSSFSAPGVSRMTRESIWEVTAKLIRAGKLALNQAGHYIHRGTLGGDDQVNARGAGHLGDDGR